MLHAHKQMMTSKYDCRW